ncbi:hypothetical protein [Hydrogenophaga sp.]|uniref:hypothetical protein n=1 Tax=Hydrogenophaga sp. TaxID=1904254 RepID=UPI0035AFFBCA
MIGAKAALFALFMSIMLSGCGGGDSNEEPAGISAYAVYQKVSYGMSYETVKGMLGEDYNYRKLDGNGWSKYSWIFSKGKDTETIFEINVRNEGITSKHIRGSQGNYSLYWI